MKKILILLMILIILIIVKARNDCERAYVIGYQAGYATNFCNIGFNYYPDREKKFEWVGIGNESYLLPYYNQAIGVALSKERGNGFWWSKIKTK